MNFSTSVQTCLKKYATFSGRASKSEYWYFYLFNLIVGMASAFINEVAYGLTSLILLLPSIAVCVRRLHDTNRSAWWTLIALVPIIGLILIYWLAKKGTEGDNNYGPNPLKTDLIENKVL